MSDSSELQVAQINIGELLSAKRHQIHESIADVANKINLPKTVIEQMEANNFSDIGPQVYVKGYLGLYAKYLGLDSLTVSEQYRNLYPADEVVIRPSIGQGLSESRRKSKRHSKGLSIIVVSISLVLLVYAGILFESYWAKKSTEYVAETNKSSTGVSGDSFTTALKEAKAAQNLANDVLGVDVIGENKSLVTDIDVSLSEVRKPFDTALAEKKLIGNIDSLTSTQVSNENLPEGILLPNSQPEVDIELESVADENTSANTNEQINPKMEQSSESSEEENSFKSSNSKVVNISVEFTQECWVRITDADKEVIVSKLYKAGDSMDVNGKAPLDMTTGAPRSMTDIKFNNQSIKLADYKVGNIKYRLPKSL